MIKAILFPLVDTIKAFNIFQYITFRAAYASVTALLVSFLFGPWVIRKLTELKLGQEVRSDGPQSHLVKAGTPTMGGVLIILAFLFAVILWQDVAQIYTWIVLVTALGLGGLGFADDFLKITKKNSDGLRAGVKFSGQMIVSFVVMLLIYMVRNEETTLLYLPFIKGAVFDLGLLYIPFGMLMIVGMSNAVNLTDGLDGLATGLTVICLIAFIILAYLTGHSEFAQYLYIPFIRGAGELSIATAALLGACVGFLWFNAHPAEVMMGDTGSLTLGGLMAVFSLLLKKEILLLIIGGVFVMETLSVIIQVLHFKRTGKRVFKMAPLHHHFELYGWAESKVVARFWILGGMFAILGLSTLKLQ
ncbi:MAG: phospho-N-acetylmuramoyl-pentapeptide-transferase [Spirochaetales bacterium]|nr:phospho-N-acetylmuramoyl-pentapeptide-transferase [Spirochaetales bacterium]